MSITGHTTGYEIVNITSLSVAGFNFDTWTTLRWNIFYRNMSEWCLCYVYAFGIVHLVGFNKRIHWPKMQGMDNFTKNVCRAD